MFTENITHFVRIVRSTIIFRGGYLQFKRKMILSNLMSS